MKKIIGIIMLLCALSIGVNAQKKGLLQPVTVSDLSTGDKAFTDNMFMRFGATFAANTFKLSFDENDQFNGISSAYLSRVGFVIGWAHYVEKEGEAINNYSLNGVLMTPTEGFSNLAVGVTVSFYNISLGAGYDFVGDSPFKKNIFGMINAQILF
jgi:hypothetical protein